MVQEPRGAGRIRRRRARRRGLVCGRRAVAVRTASARVRHEPRPGGRGDRARMGGLRAGAVVALACRKPQPDQGNRRRGRRLRQGEGFARDRDAAQPVHRVHGGPAIAAAQSRGRAAVPVPTAVVRDHRRARLGQDHRADQLRPALPARIDRRRARREGRGRHAQLRLVVHRRSGAARDRGPLHDRNENQVDRRGGIDLLKRFRPRPA